MAEVVISPRYIDKVTVRGLEPVQHRVEQDEILIDGKRVGYVGTQDAAPITLLFEISESNLAAVKEAVDQRDKKACDHRQVFVAPKMPERKGKR